MTEHLLECNALSKSFGSTSVLRGIDTAVRPGEVIGLLGLNGAGKTTLLECLLGFSPPDGGSIRLFGQESPLRLDQQARQRIGFVPQRDELLEGISGRRYLQLIANFYPAWNATLVERLAREWELPLEPRINTLSLGQRQKLSLVSALGHEPDLLVLDEPVASLDPLARRRFLQELVDIASTNTRSILFSTHIVSDLERVASRVWLLREGRLVIDEELDSLKEHCARVSLPPGVPLPEGFSDRALFRQREEQGTQVLLFTRWNAGEHARLEQACGLALEPQWLSLEDIFLELHARQEQAA